MEMMPVIEVRPVIDVPISVAIAAAAEDGRGTKAATMDCNTTAPEPAAMERCTAASEAAAVKATTATAETTTSTTTETAAATSMTAVADFDRQAVGCKFR
jgi:hypothetical protein